jgi:citrate synthase
MSTASAPSPKPVDTRGLAGQTVGDTSICAVTQTELIYRGYEIADLAENATFEEVAHLLLVGHKPSAAELGAFKAEIASMRAIPESVRDAVVRIARESPNAHPMSILRSGVSLLSHLDPDCEDNSPAAGLRKAKRLLAQIPSIIGACQMTLDDKAPVAPDASLDHSANLLWMMSGQKPDELAAKILDVSLVLYAEHDFNASTFSCRTIASTETDMHSAVCGGIGALKGPLHGGANEMAMEMLKEIYKDVGEKGIGTSAVDDWMQKAFDTKRKLMGFGHRVYKNGDHRAGILHGLGRQMAAGLKGTFGGLPASTWFDLGEQVQKIMLAKKNIHPNVDFPCGMTYFVMGIPVPQYTPIFVASRITGWAAHVLEQHADNRLIRPLAQYTGPAPRKWNG